MIHSSVTGFMSSSRCPAPLRFNIFFVPQIAAAVALDSPSKCVPRQSWGALVQHAGICARVRNHMRQLDNSTLEPIAIDERGGFGAEIFRSSTVIATLFMSGRAAMRWIFIADLSLTFRSGR